MVKYIFPRIRIANIKIPKTEALLSVQNVQKVKLRSDVPVSHLSKPKRTQRHKEKQKIRTIRQHLLLYSLFLCHWAQLFEDFFM